jgi:thymidylate synthase
MQQYLDLLKDIIENGVDKDDRTGTGTRSVFGRQLRFNLEEGFPLLTTKKLYWNGVVYENLWFMKGATNVAYLNENNVKIWNEWTDENGDLGPGYGRQFRKIIYSYYVEPKSFDYNNKASMPNFNKDILIDYSNHNTKLLGQEIHTASGPATVIKELPQSDKHGHTAFIIKFHETGAEVDAGYSSISNETVKDPWTLSVCDVGCYGDADNNDPDYETLVNIWRDMLKRCYDKNNKGYKSYGDKGIHVSPRWLVFSNFQKDAKKLYGWTLKKEFPNEYSLDKDIRLASNRYDIETCLWASNEEQSFNTSTNKPFWTTSPDNEVILFRSIGEASRKFNLNISAVHRCLKGELKTHHDWHHFEYAKQDDKVLRTKIIDQVRNVICDIKHNPDSRRHNISLWNPHDLSEMRLPPCHGNMIQFDVTNGKLGCHMYQRSVDSFLGLPWNIAGYALLTHMIAHICNLKVGDLIISTGDTHLYKNHFEQVMTQLNRKPRKLPQLVITNGHDVEDPADFRFEDFNLIDYNPYPPIKAPVSV